jgi:hypothetical protein
VWRRSAGAIKLGIRQMTQEQIARPPPRTAACQAERETVRTEEVRGLGWSSLKF